MDLFNGYLMQVSQKYLNTIIIHYIKNLNVQWHHFL